MARILLIEDEPHVAEPLRDNLEAEGHAVTIEHRGDRGLERAKAERFDLLIVDVMLPGLDGLEVCRQVRAGGATTPILFLSARGTVDDRVRGLGLGADDYLPKPFDLRELLLRVARLLARVPERAATVRIGAAEVDLERYEVRAPSGAVQVLTHKEHAVLQLLYARGGAVVSRDEILGVVWGDVYVSPRTVDNFILSLRRLIELDPAEPKHLLTVRGAGYKLVP